jgi:hypothetical protein
MCGTFGNLNIIWFNFCRDCCLFLFSTFVGCDIFIGLYLRKQRNSVGGMSVLNIKQEDRPLRSGRIVCFNILYYIILYYIILYYIILYYIMLCYVMLCYVMLCCVVLCCVVLCCVVLFCVTLCCVMLYYIMVL